MASKEYKRAKDLPIYTAAWRLLEQVVILKKKLTNEVRHDIGQDMVQGVTKFVQRYNSYAGYMIHHSSYSIRYRTWEHVGGMKRFVYAEKQLGKITPLIEYNQYNQLKQSYYELRKNKYSGIGIQGCQAKQAA